MVLALQSSLAAELEWDVSADAGVQGGAGDWDTTATNWTTDDGANRAAWDNAANAADTALFSTGTGRVTVGSDIFLKGITVTSATTSTIGGRGSMTYVLQGAGTLNFGGQQGVIDSSGTAGSLQIGNDMLGTGGLSINAVNAPVTAGTWIYLSGDNSGLSGDITIQNGMISVHNQNNLGANKIFLQGNAGILSPSNYAGTGTSSVAGPNSLTLSNDIEVTGTGNVLRMFGTRATTFSGVLSGDGDIIKDSGTTILTGENTLSGSITINARNGGGLRVGNGGTSGTLGTASVVNNETLVFNRSDNFTITNDISGSGTVRNDGSGTLTLSGNNSYGGTTTVSGGNLTLANPSAIPAGTINVNANRGLSLSVGDDPVLEFTLSDFDNLWANTFTGVNLNAASYAGIDTTAGDVTLSGIYTGTRGLLKDGSGMLTLTGANTYTGGTMVNSGILKLDGGDNRLATDSYVTVGNDATALLDLNGHDQQLESLRSSNVSGAVGNNSATLSKLTLNPQADRPYGGRILGNLRLEVTGDSELSVSNRIRLTADNSGYTGGTLVSGSALGVEGDLSLGAVPASFDADNIAIEQGGVLLNQAFSTPILDANRGIVIGAGGGGLMAGWGTSLRIDGAISGDAANNLTIVSNNGTVILNGDNSGLAGDLEVQSALRVGTGGTTGTLGTGAVTILSGANLSFNRDGELQVASTISGDGSIIYMGPGTIGVTGANSYAGGTAVNGGTLAIGHDTALGTGTINWQISAIRSTNASGRTIANAITYSGDMTFGSSDTGNLLFTGAVNAGSLDKTFTVENEITEFSGVISGSGARIKDGPGTLVFSGGNTYSGDTVISGGTLALGSSGSISNSNVVLNGGAFNVSAVSGGYTVGSGQTIVGTGSVIGNIEAGGTISPGGPNGIGVISHQGSVLLDQGTVSLRFDSRTGQCARLVIDGNLNVLNFAAIQVIDLATSASEEALLPNATKLVLVEYTGSFGAAFLDINNELDVPEGATVTIGVNEFTLSYDDSALAGNGAKFITLTVPGEPESGYAAWAAIHAGGQAPDLDFDGDGVPNGVEYFMGETGASFTPNPQIVTDGTTRTITWPRDPTASATFAIETSTTLAADEWTIITPPDPSIDLSDPNQVVFTLPEGTKNLFVRLAVTVDP